MMPIGDDNTDRRSLPIVTYIFIILNVLMFFLELTRGETFIEKWAFTPSQFAANPASQFPNLFTAMFMHGGWAHLIGNMVYLWIFGDNVEDYLGKIPYIIFYLVCGVAASLVQFAVDPGSSIPNLGASGAIAGVLGAYIFLRPQGSVKVLVGNGIIQMPALLVIGFWFVLQFMSGIGSLHSTQDNGGVAYMAHVGGFLSGLAIAFVASLFINKRQI